MYSYKYTYNFDNRQEIIGEGLIMTRWAPNQIVTRSSRLFYGLRNLCDWPDRTVPDGMSRKTFMSG